MGRGRVISAAGGIALSVAVAVAAPFEGETLTAVIPVRGDVPTICRGHTVNVKLGMTATPAQCDEWFADDMSAAFNVLSRKVTVPMPETRRGALASFVFNVGEGAFGRSTLLKKLNAGDWRGACNELSRWVHKDGRVLAGLVKRRAVERGMCLLEDPPMWKVYLGQLMQSVGFGA